MELYVDGRPVFVNNPGKPARVTDFTGSQISVGARVSALNPATATLDELRVSGRARTRGEILASYHAGLAVTSLALDPIAPTQMQLLPLRQAKQFLATALGAGGAGGPSRDVTGLVRWTSDNAAVLAVDPSPGLVRAVGVGTATLTARLDTVTASVTIQVADPHAPAATLAAPGVPVGGGSDYTFTVTYADDAAVRAATLGFGDVRVRGPNGVSRFPSLVSVNAPGDGPTRVATYRLDIPGGTWDAADDGTYFVELKGIQVADVSGNFAPPAALGSFTVNGRAPLKGDANRDGGVNGSDFAILAGNFGNTGRTWATGDFNGDERVDGSDFALLAGNFGRTIPPPPPAVLASRPNAAAGDFSLPTRRRARSIVPPSRRGVAAGALRVRYGVATSL
jgi:hypothetical protein